MNENEDKYNNQWIIAKRNYMLRIIILALIN
jgi:hypothetical protein